MNTHESARSDCVRRKGDCELTSRVRNIIIIDCSGLSLDSVFDMGRERETERETEETLKQKNKKKVTKKAMDIQRKQMS